MTERLLIPSWNAPRRSLDDWRARLEGLGHPPALGRGEPDETWLILEPLGLRLLAVIEGAALTALHAEIDADDPAPALDLLDRAAAALDWEVHDDEDDDDDDEEE